MVDSITELGPADAGCLAVSGSHGGASSARYAIAARPLLSVFNDAGVGLDRAGLVALEQLQAQGLAACTVSHLTARIGEADSSLETGVLSYRESAGFAGRYSRPAWPAGMRWPSLAGAADALSG